MAPATWCFTGPEARYDVCFSESRPSGGRLFGVGHQLAIYACARKPKYPVISPRLSVKTTMPRTISIAPAA